MHYNELFIKISYLTKLNNIKQTEIGKPIGLDKAAINKRAKNNSKFSDSEIKQIEQEFNVSLSDVVICENSKKRYFDENILLKQKNFGNKILELKNINNLSNIQMAGLLNISEEELQNLIESKSIPNITVLYNIKQNFKVSVDWLIFSD